MADFFCSYCGEVKPDTEQTADHVIPQKLGGAVHPVNPFKLNTVCKRCNSICGFFVDGPLSLNSLIHSHHAIRLMEFVDVEGGGVAPLNYMGLWQEETVKIEGQDCEMWLGPTGDMVLHFHKPYPEVPGTLGMVSPKVVKDIDPGFVLVFVATNNPVWHPTVVKSVLAHFSGGTKIYFANMAFQGNQLPVNVLPPDDKMKELIVKVKEVAYRKEGGAHVRGSIDLGFAERYQAKAALGFGALFLKPEFQTSSYATFLRNYLWTKSTAERSELPLRGKGVLSEQNSAMLKLCGIPSGITVILMPMPDGVALAMNFFAQMDFLVMISDDLNHWPEDLDQSGIAFGLICGLRSCAGPMPLIEFISGVVGNNPHSSISKLILEAEKSKKLRPPHMI